MNLAISEHNLEGLTPDRLPSPQRREGRLRLLSIGLPIMGLNSYNRELQRYLADRDDVEAVHITLIASFMMKVMRRASARPLNMDYQCYRAAQQWRRAMHAWMRGPLPLDRFDAVLVCPQFYAWAYADQRARRDFVLGVHIDATTMNTVRDYGDSPVTTRPLIRVEREVFARCDLVSCMGLTWAGHSARDDYGVPEDRILWVPPMAPKVRSPKGARPDPADEDRPPRIVFVGNDWERKGGKELLRWHQERWAGRAELHFIGAGAVPDREYRAVVWHGRVDRDRIINELLPTMDLFVMPTKREMSSWAGMEAMAAGLPVVLSRIGGIPDLVVEGQTGFLPAAPSDEGAGDGGFIAAVEKLLDDADLRRRMGDNARARALERFSRERVYGDLVDRVMTLAFGGATRSVNVAPDTAAAADTAHP